MYEDETLVCRDCGQEFVFSASEQAFFAEKGFMNKPSRCPKCRAARRAQNGNGSSAPRQMYDVVCANCGKATQVPFQPRGDRPVLCRECFEAREIELMHFGVRLRKRELFPVAAADAELVNAAVAENVVAAAQHAGVA